MVSGILRVCLKAEKSEKKWNWKRETADILLFY